MAAARRCGRPADHRAEPCLVGASGSSATREAWLRKANDAFEHDRANSRYPLSVGTGCDEVGHCRLDLITPAHGTPERDAHPPHNVKGQPRHSENSKKDIGGHAGGDVWQTPNSKRFRGSPTARRRWIKIERRWAWVRCPGGHPWFADFCDAQRGPFSFLQRVAGQPATSARRAAVRVASTPR